MFTGIVTHRAALERIESGEGDALTELQVRPTPPLPDPEIGESIALDGTCLTVTAATDDGVLTFQAVPETLRKTTLGDRGVGDEVNLERALRVGDALGGHWVQGHVDGVGRLVSRTQQGEDVRFVIAVDDDLHAGMLAKASVTLDGVSLTVGEVWREAEGGRFSVYLIPHTLKVTGLGGKHAGDRLNVEADVLGRWVGHHLERMLGKNGAPPAELGG